MQLEFSGKSIKGGYMTFYDSFARMGKSLDEVIISSMAWPWRHYNGLQYQSYSERLAASEPFSPMAWVWCHYRGAFPYSHIPEPTPVLIEETLIDVPDVSYNEEVRQIEEYLHQVNYPVVEQAHRFPAAQLEDDDPITIIDIVKLMAALLFAASIIYGVHALRG